MELPNLSDRRVLLGVSGGIAAYKSAELCRLLVRAGAQVSVMMTAAARRFVGEATFAALSGRPVASDLFDPQQEARIGHIELADRAELLVFAPATASLLARLAHGVADDLVSTVYLAYSGPVLLAPAMNVNMWAHPATQDNVATLRARGHHLVGPASGEMACGHVGAGRMAEPPEILDAVTRLACARDLAGKRVLVSAGPTREALDPVRFLSNRSTGRMGYALAAEAAQRGATVVLVSGPTSIAPPPGVELVAVTSAEQMADAVIGRASDQDAIIMAAAVADYRPLSAGERKLKKDTLGARHALELERTRDILAELGQRDPRPLLVGFAAETGGDLDVVGPAKLARKGCDLLVANDVLEPGAGFGSETNRVVIYSADGGRDALPMASKRAVAAAVLDRMAALLAPGDDGSAAGGGQR